MAAGRRLFLGHLLSKATSPPEIHPQTTIRMCQTGFQEESAWCWGLPTAGALFYAVGRLGWPWSIGAPTQLYRFLRSGHIQIPLCRLAHAATNGYLSLFTPCSPVVHVHRSFIVHGRPRKDGPGGAFERPRQSVGEPATRLHGPGKALKGPYLCLSSQGAREDHR